MMLSPELAKVFFTWDTADAVGILAGMAVCIVLFYLSVKDMGR